MYESKIKFAYLNNKGRKTISVIDGSSCVDEILEAFKDFMMGAGFHPSNIECIQYIERCEDQETLDFYEE